MTFNAAEVCQTRPELPRLCLPDETGTMKVQTMGCPSLRFLWLGVIHMSDAQRSLHTSSQVVVPASRETPNPADFMKPPVDPKELHEYYQTLKIENPVWQTDCRALYGK